MSAKIKAKARGLAALGRGDDKMLVHMTPHEVAGLQKLAVATGGSLTINPKTGLPEAGWLSTILPMVAAGAATFFSGGTLAPLVAAAYGAGGGALGAKIEGGDPLMGALGGALGGVGGSGITSGLMNAGKAAAGQAAGAAATQQAAANTAMGNAASTITPQALGSAAASNVPGSSMNALSAGLQSAVPSAQTLGGITPSMSVGQIAGSQAAEQAVAQMGNKAALSAGIKTLGDKGAAMGIWKGLTPTAKLGTTATGIAALDAASQPSGSGKKSKAPMYYHSSSTIDPKTGHTTFGPGYWSKDYDYANRGRYDPNNEIEDVPVYKKGGNPYGQASGGVVGMAKGGRYVRGRGDGVSDSIPAKIKGKGKKAKGQAAALADGEFVIPARHVSELGNGSSDAGAQRLYAMMHRIEQRRKAAPYDADSRAYSELPA